MSDSKLFALNGEQVTELAGSLALLERDLQQKIEQHMPTFLGVQFLASEYATGKTHKGRIEVMMPVKKDPRLQLYLKLPGHTALNDGFSRDVSNTGHWGTGDLELNIRNAADLEKAKAGIIESYERS